MIRGIIYLPSSKRQICLDWTVSSAMYSGKRELSLELCIDCHAGHVNGIASFRIYNEVIRLTTQCLRSSFSSEPPANGDCRGLVLRYTYSFTNVVKSTRATQSDAGFSILIHAIFYKLKALQMHYLIL